MNFNTILTFFALVLFAFAGQSKAGWLRDFGKRIVSFTFSLKLNQNEINNI